MTEPSSGPPTLLVALHCIAHFDRVQLFKPAFTGTNQTAGRRLARENRSVRSGLIRLADLEGLLDPSECDTIELTADLIEQFGVNSALDQRARSIHVGGSGTLGPS